MSALYSSNILFSIILSLLHSFFNVSALSRQITAPPFLCCISNAFNRCLHPFENGGFIIIKSYSFIVSYVKKSSCTTLKFFSFNTARKFTSFSIQSIFNLIVVYHLLLKSSFFFNASTIFPLPADGSRTVCIIFQSNPSSILSIRFCGVG